MENVFIYFSWKSGNFVINDGHSLWGQLVSQKPHIFGRWTFLPLLYFCSIWPVLMKDLRKQQLLWNIYILTKRGPFATIVKSLATQRFIYPYVSIWQKVHLSSHQVIKKNYAVEYFISIAFECFRLSKGVYLFHTWQ